MSVAKPTVGPAMYEGRIQDVAYENFGPFPVQTDEEAMTAIERGIFELRQCLATAEAERDALREWNVRLRDDRGGQLAEASRAERAALADAAALRERVTRAEALRAEFCQDFEDLLLVATKDEDAEGFISAYHFKTGALHRLLGKVRTKFGVAAPTEPDGASETKETR